MFKVFLLLLLFVSSSFTKELTDPAMIYTKKCKMCHWLNPPENMAQKAEMSAPYITLAMRSVTIGIDAVEEPKDKKELRKLTIEHIEDYIFNPSADKSFCENIIFKNYRYMPSLTRFISKKEASIVAPWIFDNFAPKKYR